MELVIETPGTHLSYQNGMILLESGQRTDEISILQIQSVHILTNARISSQVLLQCSESGIPVYFETDLEVKAMLWTASYGSTAEIRKKQALFAQSDLRWKLVKRLILRKIENRFHWLAKTAARRTRLPELIPQDKPWETDILKIPDNPDAIRGFEGAYSKKFFEIYKRLLPEKFRFEKRTYRKTRHLTEMLLNYAYGILYKEILKATVFAGLDPHIGFFHRAQYAKPSLTYDMIEPYRIWAEAAVFRTLRHPEIKKSDIDIFPVEQIPREIKKILITEMLEYLTRQKIRHNNLIRTPRTHIRLDMNRVASYLLNLETKKILQNIPQIP